MTLTREAILAKNDIAIKEVDVPEWGGSVHIRQLTRGEQDTYLKRQYGDTRLKQNTKKGSDGSQEISAINIYGHDTFIVACAACDETGAPLFKPTDAEELKKKNGLVIGRLATAIIEFSGMAEDVKAAEQVKN